MISTNQEIEQLLDDEFENAIITRGKFRDEVVVKFKGSQNQCTFYFTKFEKEDDYCADFFKGHNCLSFGFDYNNYNGGIGFMSVADEKDMSNEIIDFVSQWLKKSKRKQIKELNLFDFTY